MPKSTGSALAACAARDRLARLLDRSDLAHLVPHLAPETLQTIIHAHGLDACGALVAGATAEQLAAVLDLDLWRAAASGQDERFDAVRFAYPGQTTDAIAGLDLHLPSGQRVALVGETGSGKSTFVKLLARFYDPSSGRVVVDGADLRELDPGAYRRRLGYVPQEPFLFAGTVRDNLAYGRPDATDDQVWQAVDAVGLDDLVADLPGGLDHWLVERGRSLSTGQRQLICLARALVADPVLLLLDEATSNLDLASEARIERAMDVLSEGRTTVVIAHRLATAARADRILVMEAGRIVEDGSHDELLAEGGYYHELWRAYEGVALAG